MARRKIKRVAIVGCGIAGPVLGMFLQRVDIESIICERRSHEALDEGLFLGLAPNGMNVLSELGVHRDVEAIGVPCQGFQFQNSRGRTIATIDRSGDAARFGTRLQMVLRGELHGALTEAARVRGIPVRFGRKLVGIDRSTPARVVAAFEDGAREEADVLIGCDGINSTTRQLTLPGSPAPAYSGLLDFGGIADCPGAPLDTGVNVMVFGRRAFFGAFKTPAGQVWWFHNCGEKLPPERGRRDPSALRARILELHEDDPAWIRDVIASTPSVVGPFALNDILSMPRWHSDRVCLVGDAAHATTPSAGQGASLAFEDAMVLARCLRDIDDPGRAFTVFERERRSRVEKIVRGSRRNGNGKAVSGPVGEWVRDRMLPFFLGLGTRAQEQQYAYRIDWAHRAA
jgi:2-polyprenyl-6-methoxyphenol hydroxylase-like FAD-dependent oxidoreductase